MKILAFKPNHRTFLITINSHKETNNEETYFIKILELYALRIDKIFYAIF